MTTVIWNLLKSHPRGVPPFYNFVGAFMAGSLILAEMIAG